MNQLRLSFTGDRRGGSRCGAGRKRLPAAQRHTPHRARPKHQAGHPVHVTLRCALRSLRSQHVSKTVLGALRDSNRDQFRIAHYSIQDNHLHLLVEAETKVTLSSGMRGLMIRLARRINRLLFRRGRFWADRWHGHALKSPREVRNALVYVLKNRSKHQAHLGRVVVAELDPLSSATSFNGFARAIPSSFRSIGPPCVVSPRTWLLQTGWRRHGTIRVNEAPKPNRRNGPQ
jgi:REP element-mobilizing transposase RayT